LKVDLMTEILGILAGICTTVSFIPQVLHIRKTRNTASISMGMYVVFCTGLALWLLYGIQMQAVSIILANSVTLVLAVYILVMKFKLG